MKDISANFKLKEPDSSSPTLIFLKSYFNYQRFTYSTGWKIHPQYWHEVTQRPITFRLEQIKKEIKAKPTAELKLELRTIEEVIKQGIRENPRFQLEMQNIENDLGRYKDELVSAYQYVLRQKETPTPEMLCQLMDKVFKQEKQLQTDKNAFFESFDEFIEYKTQVNSLLTVKKYDTLKTRLEEFEKEKRYKLSFESIDLIFYDKFKHFLLTRENTRIEGGTGLLNDTIAKYMSAMKSFMQWTMDRNYHNNSTFQHKQFAAKKKVKNEIVTLTEEELNKLYKHDFSEKPRLGKVRDIFCFALYTGQRWSDIERFSKEDIKDNAWEFMSYKTKKQIRVPFKGFISPALDILKKYDYMLPLISLTNFNDYIKQVGEEAEINEEVVIKRFSAKKLFEIRKPKHKFMTSHMARRTCITILLQKGVPPTTIMKLTGHTDLKTLMKYENTSEDALGDALENT